MSLYELLEAKCTLCRPLQLPFVLVNSFVGMDDDPMVKKGYMEVRIQWGGEMSGCKGR
jgi:hypothetical protein